MRSVTDAIHFEFGDDQFAVVVSVAETFDDKPKFNQIEISITGDGWKLHSPETETLRAAAGETTFAASGFQTINDWYVADSSAAASCGSMATTALAWPSPS